MSSAGEVPSEPRLSALRLPFAALKSRFMRSLIGPHTSFHLLALMRATPDSPCRTPNDRDVCTLGITTAGRSATYTLQALVASLLQGALETGATANERNYYWTLVTYFNSLRELGRALVLMQDDVPVSIRQFAVRRNEERRKIEAPAELTSRVRSYEIRDMLDRLKKPASDSDAVDLLVASNMISVGMDIPRLGLMVVNAQPKTLSEYIQATSRVGRGDVPGFGHHHVQQHAGTRPFAFRNIRDVASMPIQGC